MNKASIPDAILEDPGIVRESTWSVADGQTTLTLRWGTKGVYLDVQKAGLGFGEDESPDEKITVILSADRVAALAATVATVAQEMKDFRKKGST